MKTSMDVKIVPLMEVRAKEKSVTSWCRLRMLVTT